MGKLYANTRPNHRHQKIGRKVLRSDRMAAVLYSAQPPKDKPSWLHFSISKRATLITMSVIFVVGAVGVGGYVVYANYATEQNKITEQKKVERDLKNSAKANECREQKVAENASQLNELTYDELYKGCAE